MRRYLPENCGLRFSMKACRPSRKSALSMQAVPIALIAFMSRALSSFSTSAMVILAALIASGAFCEIVVGDRHGLAPELIVRDHALDRPMRSASAESMRMPVYIRSRAQDGPTSDTRCRKPS